MWIKKKSKRWNVCVIQEKNRRMQNSKNLSLCLLDRLNYEFRKEFKKNKSIKVYGVKNFFYLRHDADDEWNNPSFVSRKIHFVLHSQKYWFTSIC